MNNFKVLPNFLPDNTHQNIYNILLGNNFPWFYESSVTKEYQSKTIDDFLFFHHLYSIDQGSTSTYFHEILMPLMGRLQFTQILRGKINLYPKKEKPLQHDFHIDRQEPHMVALYSVNTNNGYTIFEDGKKINSVANQLVIFQGHIKHASSVQTDENVRVNININFLD